MSRRYRQRFAVRPEKLDRRAPIQELGPDFEDEIDIDHSYARELFEHEQQERANFANQRESA